MKSFYECPVYNECFVRKQNKSNSCKEISDGFCTKYIEVIRRTIKKASK